METVLLIDGENFKSKIRSVFRNAGKPNPIWHSYNFKELLENVLKGITTHQKVFYFARIKEHPERKEKSKQLIEEQRRLKTHLERQGFTVVLSGRVRGQIEESADGKPTLVFREKGVDVKIAVDMISSACDKKVSEIIVGSSDSDLQPAIQEIRKRNVRCVYICFEMQPNKGLTFTTNRTILIRNAEVFECEKVKS